MVCMHVCTCVYVWLCVAVCGCVGGWVYAFVYIVGVRIDWCCVLCAVLSDPLGPLRPCASMCVYMRVRIVCLCWAHPVCAARVVFSAHQRRVCCAVCVYA